MNSNSVIFALEAGLAATPNDFDLTLHLAQLLAKEPSELERAFTLAQESITLQPSNPQAIELALSLARMLEHHELACEYQSQLSALTSRHEEVLGSPEGSQPKGVIVTTKSKTEYGNHIRGISGYEHGNDDGVVKPELSHVRPTQGVKLRLVSSRGDVGSSELETSELESKEPGLSLSDVGGMDVVKEHLQLSFLGPLNNPELTKAYGKDLGGGMLLFGPPGCGKTYIAKALAGEIGAKFMSVGLTDILDMHLGESERKLHDIFEYARSQSPAVLFIDELDALGQKRSQLRSSGMRTLVNQLLSEMDGLEEENKNLFILAATNHPWDVDPALCRPGRFDNVISVFPPERDDRVIMLRQYLKGKPLGDVDLEALADACPMFSGADLVHLCNAAVEIALKASIDQGKIRPLEQEDFNCVLTTLKASTLCWFDTAKKDASQVNEHGCYDELLEYIRCRNL